MASVPLPGAPVVFHGVSCSWFPLAGSAPIWLQLAGLLLQWTFIVGLAMSGYTTWCSTLCQRSFPFCCLPLVGSATFLAPVCWSTLVVEPCCWVGGVFDASLGFLPCAVLFLRGLQFAQLPCSRFPWGFSALSVTGCLSFCFPGDVGWASALPFFFLCFSCSGWLAGVRWVLHPVSGCSSWGCVVSLGDSVITLLAFPYLRVGELLDCGVYGVSELRSCSLGCPSWFVLLFMSLFVLHLLLGWGRLVTGLWPHLQLLCVGLF